MSSKLFSSATAAMFLAVAAIVHPAASAAAPPLSEVIVSTPNRLNPFVGQANPLPPMEALAGADHHLQVKVGPPEASLSVSVFEPKNDSTEPKATILVIHGVLGRGVVMLGAADNLTRAGYRVVLVDLRGHGRSTGKFLTFGIQEAKDLSQVIDTLGERGHLAGKLGVYGISYGATTAIHLAGRDPRVRAVVAVAPFNNIRQTVPHYAPRVMVPGLGWSIPEETYQRAIDEAGRRGRFDPDNADAAKAIRQTSAQVLLVHGKNDWVVPHRNSDQLHEAARDHSELVSIPWLGHVAIWCDPTREVAARSRAWFDRWLVGPTAQ